MKGVKSELDGTWGSHKVGGLDRGLPELIHQQWRGERVRAGGMFAQRLECLPHLDNNTRAVTLQPTAQPRPYAGEAKWDRRTEGQAAGGLFRGGTRAGLARQVPRASPQILRGVPRPRRAGGSSSA